MKKAVELDSSPAMLNDAAYSAADAGILPDLSKQWAEKSVSQLEDQTAKITLSNLQAEDLRRMALLAAYWDTLGWAYFRSGELTVAEKYLHSAWVLDQAAVTGDHLGQLYEREGKKKEAAHMYELAYAVDNTLSGLSERYLNLTGNDISDSAAPRLIRRGAKITSETVWAGEELSHVRTLKVERITTKTVSAEFFVLLSPGPKVDGVKFIRGAEELKNAGQRLSSLKFPVEFPDAHPARIVRRGILMCGVAGCDFTLLLPNTVQSVN